MDKDIKELLDAEAYKINNPDFIQSDPVQFPRRFDTIEDIEITAFLASMVAWGNRKMICKDIDRMLTLMDHSPYKFMMDEGYEDLNPDMNLHRTFFVRHLKHFLKGVRRIYKEYGNLDAFSRYFELGKEEAPAWRLVELMNNIIIEENGEAMTRCLPLNISQSALKRVNMALRWLVRDDGIVDIGLWKSIPKSKLYIPLDVHVGNVSRELGLLTRKSNDRKSVEQLTQKLRDFRPEDPAYYDYALFGIGINQSMNIK